MECQLTRSAMWHLASTSNAVPAGTNPMRLIDPTAFKASFPSFQERSISMARAQGRCDPLWAQP